MSADAKVLDANGVELRVGSVICEPGVGAVRSITDPDGDVDCEGRMVGIAPEVTVFYTEHPEGEETFPTFWLARGPGEDAPYRCDDVVVR